MHRSLRLIFIVLLAIWLQPAMAQSDELAQSIAAVFNPSAVGGPTNESARPNDDTDLLHSGYQQRHYAPRWVQQHHPTAQALHLLTTLRDAGAYGLRSKDYDGDALSETLTRLNAASTPESWAKFDVALSTATLGFIKHLHYGRVSPRSAGFRLDQPRNELDLNAQLDALAVTENIDTALQALEPPFAHYRFLKSALARYRLLAADAELTHLPALTARTIKPGEPYEGAAALRKLLIATDDMPQDQTAAADITTLDSALVTAIQHFQTRHGLTADGALGKQTFIALATPLTARVRQIELTLERWRWFPALVTPPIVVNIPQFRLFALHTNQEREADMLRMDVIVGRVYPAMRTPTFIGDLKYLVFRPYWDVPRSIVKNEILSSLQRDPSYLAKHNYELVRGQSDASPVVAATPENIAALRAGQLRLRQRPGPNNPLGAVKFMLPNDYNVYLHSTSAPHYFSASQRTFSHGCIRVSDPVALAEYVLRNTAGEWTHDKIVAAMEGPLNQRITLQTSIPVMIVYGTVMARETGEVQFFNDIYGYDRKLETLLGLQPIL